MSKILEILNDSNIRVDKVTKRLEALKTMFNMVNGDVTTFHKGFALADTIDAVTVYQNADCTVTLGTWRKSQAVWPDHCHTDSVEYIIVIKGQFLLNLSDGIRIMEKGDCASIPLGVEHSVKALIDDSQMLGICVPPELAYRVEEKCQK